MKSRVRLACAVLLAAAASPAMALQLGQIQVKSSLDQPLVAAIPLHPKSLTELDGLSVSLAPAADFAHAGLQRTAVDKSLQFHVVTDNNGQKLILVTSRLPITQPYLDFLILVNTRSSKQVREFVVLLNPVIAAPAPVVRSAPVASPPVRQPQRQPQPQSQPQPQPQSQSQRSLAFPPPLVVPKPKPQSGSQVHAQSQQKPQQKPQAKLQSKPKAQSQPQPEQEPQAKSQQASRQKPQPKPEPQSQQKPQSRQQPQSKQTPKLPSKPKSESTPVVSGAGTTVHVAYGDTLYGIAKQHTNGARGNINRMMLALKAANPRAFFKDNIDDLKAGAILRIPARDEINKISIAEANAEVRRQYEAWRAAKPHAATVLAGSAAKAAAKTAPKPAKTAPASDHLSLVAPTGKSAGTSNRPGVEGGTGSETVAGLRHRLQTSRGSLISLKQSNADLESRVKSLNDIAGKGTRLLSMKDARIAKLQQALSRIHAGANAPAAGLASAGVASASTAATAPKAAAAAAGGTKPATSALAGHPVAAPNPNPSHRPARQATPTAQQPWYMRPVAWAIAGLIVLALILIGLFSRKRGSGKPTKARGPLLDPDDVSTEADTVQVPVAPDDDESLREWIAENPDDLEAHLHLCRLYYEQADADRFLEAARAMHAEVTDPDAAEWRETVAMGEALVPGDPLFAQAAVVAENPYMPDGAHEPLDLDQVEPDSDPDVTVVRAPEVESPVPLHDEAEDVTIVAAGAADMPPEDPVVPLEDPTTVTDEPAFSDDPVDTKLDLARAYLDMGDPVGARAMLEEVIEEGSQMQKDEARRLLAEAEVPD